MATERTTEARAQHPDRALRAKICLAMNVHAAAFYEPPDRRLRASMVHALGVEAAEAWQRYVEERADEYTYQPPLHGVPRYTPDYVEYRLYYNTSRAFDYAYADIHTAVRVQASRLFCEYQLGNRPNAAVWRRWLSVMAHVVTKRFVEGIDRDVARRMAEKFGFQYNLDFGFYFADGRAIFVLLDGEDLHPDWGVLADVDVRDRCKDDVDYLRMMYAYNAYKRLLVRIQHEYVFLPSGERSLEWVLAAEWTCVAPEEAKKIIARDMGYVDETEE